MFWQKKQKKNTRANYYPILNSKLFKSQKLSILVRFRSLSYYHYYQLLPHWNQSGNSELPFPFHSVFCLQAPRALLCFNFNLLFIFPFWKPAGPAFIQFIQEKSVFKMPFKIYRLKKRIYTAPPCSQSEVCFCKLFSEVWQNNSRFSTIERFTTPSFLRSLNFA